MQVGLPNELCMKIHIVIVYLNLTLLFHRKVKKLDFIYKEHFVSIQFKIHNAMHNAINCKISKHVSSVHKFFH